MMEQDSDDSFDELIAEARERQTSQKKSEPVNDIPTNLLSDDDSELSLLSLSGSKFDEVPADLLSDDGDTDISLLSLSETEASKVTTSPSVEPRQLNFSSSSVGLDSSKTSYDSQPDIDGDKEPVAGDVSSSDDEAYERFLQTMKEERKQTQPPSKSDKNASLREFIVSDDESLSEAATSEDEDVFYLRTTNLLNKQSSLPTDESDDLEKQLSKLDLQDSTDNSLDTDTSERSSSVFLHNSLLFEDDDEVSKSSSIPSKDDDDLQHSDDSFDELLKAHQNRSNFMAISSGHSDKSKRKKTTKHLTKSEVKQSFNQDSSLTDSDDDVILIKETINTPAPRKMHTAPTQLVRAAGNVYTPAASRTKLGGNLRANPIWTEPRLRKPQSSFIASLSAHFDGNKLRDRDAERYVSHFKKHKDELVEKLSSIYNQTVFDNKLGDVKVSFNKRLLKTAGLCKYLTTHTSKLKQASVELSEKVCDTAERVRDTLIHELCHAAVWIVNGVEDGHGRYWQYWVRKAELTHRDLPPIRRCHSYDITTKFVYRCTKCGHQVGRHSKSLNIEKKVCGRCRGNFELLTRTAQGLNTPSTSTPNKFAMFVKHHDVVLSKHKKIRLLEYETQHREPQHRLCMEHKKISLFECETQQKVPQHRLCVEHKNQPHQLGCRTCLSLMCVRCVSGLTLCKDGKPHELMALDELVSTLVEENINAEITVKEDELEALFEHTSKLSSEYNDKTTEMVQHLRATRDEQLEAIRQKYDKLEEELIEKRQRKGVEIGDFLEYEVLRMGTQLSNQRLKVETKLKHTNEVDVLRGYKELPEELQKLINKELPELHVTNIIEMADQGVKRDIELKLVYADDVVIGRSFPFPFSMDLVKNVSLPSNPRFASHYKGCTYVGLSDNRIARVDSSYQLVESFITCSGIIKSLTVYEDRLYALLDVGSTFDLVRVYNLRGSQVAQWKVDSNAQQWRNLMAVVSDLIVIADQDKKELTLYSLSGQLLKHIPCELLGEHNCFMCAAGYCSVIISNSEASAVSRINLTDSAVMWTRSVSEPRGVCCYGAQYVLAAKKDDMIIYILDAKRGWLLSRLKNNALYGSWPYSLQAVGSNLLVADADSSLPKQVQYYRLMSS